MLAMNNWNLKFFKYNIHDSIQQIEILRNKSNKICIGIICGKLQITKLLKKIKEDLRKGEIFCIHGFEDSVVLRYQFFKLDL